MSPRLAFSKATDLLPVTGPVSSQKEKATSAGRLFYLVLLILKILYPVYSALALKLTCPSSTATENRTRSQPFCCLIPSVLDAINR